MRKKQIIGFCAAVAMMAGNLLGTAFAAESKSTESYVTMDLDKTTAKKGEIITANVRVNNIGKLTSFQVNIKYNPNVLQAVNPKTKVPFKGSTSPVAGNILVNEDYSPLPVVGNDIKNGILAFGRGYVDFASYKKANKPEGTGILGTIGFLVLKEGTTKITFQNTKSLPSGINGTAFFDWDGAQIKSGYQVIQPKAINGILKLTLNKSSMGNGIEDVKLDTAPVIVNGRMLLPIKPVLEAMGGTLAWDATEKRVELKLGGKEIKLWINKKDTQVNGEQKATDVAPQIMNGRTMLPLKFVTENLGATIEWDDKTKTATVKF